MKEVGLVLSGGGARGFAHIGVIKVLDKLKVAPSCVSGCSMGSVIGALYYIGYSGKDIEKKIKELTLKNILSISFNKNSKKDKIENYLNIIFENKNFEDLKIPLYVNAVDLKTRKEIIFYKGNLARAVRASIGIPGIFKPILMNDRILVDGGLKNNIPVRILLEKEKIKKIISINVGLNEKLDSILEKTQQYDQRKPPKLTNILIKSLLIMQSNEYMINYSKKHSNVFITPNLKGYSIIDFKKYKDIIKKGEVSTSKYEKNIKKLFKNKIWSTFNKN